MLKSLRKRLDVSTTSAVIVGCYLEGMMVYGEQAGIGDEGNWRPATPPPLHLKAATSTLLPENSPARVPS